MCLEKEGFSSLVRYDLTSGKKKVVSSPVILREGESCFLAFSREEPEKDVPLSKLALPAVFNLEEVPENTLVLDRPSYSCDGAPLSASKHVRLIQRELLQKRFRGEVRLCYEFFSRIPLEDFFIECESSRVKEVSLNGFPCRFVSENPDNRARSRYSSDTVLRVGSNRIDVTLDYFQNDHVYEILSKDGVTEGEINCLTFDSSVEPVYLKGRFGVFGEFQKGNAPDVISGKGFYLDSPRTTIRSLVEDGFPFFAGDIVLKAPLFVNTVYQELEISKRFQLIDLFINDEHVAASMFDRRFDLSPYLKEGENELKVVLTVSRRNELGPFHSPSEEDMVTSPESFEVGSEETDPFYHFVSTIL